MSRFCLTIIFLTLPFAGPAVAASDAAPIQFSSGEHRVALIELFTSEGCSSCPPADRWLSKLRSDSGLWTEFVPIAFHVDYWDYIGWADRFARAEYSDRQRQYVAQGGARFVYTPGFFHNGQEWQGWRSARSVSRDRSKAAELTLLVDGNDIAIHYDGEQLPDARLLVHIAVLGMSLETQVRAGENKGESLQHDFVALNIQSVPLNKAGSGFKAVTRMPEIDHNVNNRALVAWVSQAEQQSPMQSVGGFLPQTSEQ